MLSPQDYRETRWPSAIIQTCGECGVGGISCLVCLSPPHQLRLMSRQFLRIRELGPLKSEPNSERIRFPSPVHYESAPGSLGQGKTRHPLHSAPSELSSIPQQ